MVDVGPSYNCVLGKRGLPVLVAAYRKWYASRKWFTVIGRRLPKVAMTKCPRCKEMTVMMSSMTCRTCGYPADEGLRQPLSEKRILVEPARDVETVTTVGGPLSEAELGGPVLEVSGTEDAIAALREPFEREPVWDLVEGENCPACGKRVGRRTKAKSGEELG